MTPHALAADDPDLAAVLDLMRTSFASLEPRIAPPSSIHRLTLTDLAARAGRSEVWALGRPPLAALIAAPEMDALLLSKLAVAPEARRQSLARILVTAMVDRARSLVLPKLRLQTRIELTENRATFAALGFVQTGQTTHPGFDRPTSLTFERPV